MAPRVSRRLTVRGRVQGVGFRHFAAQSAAAHRICGWVRNRLDGSVEALGEGTAEDLAAWLGDLRRGPMAGLGISVEDLPSDTAPDAPPAAGFRVLPTA